MNDPWDVKCVRQAGQYVSCMKINGVPLIPPVLSNECRKEMQYYKLLAKEVEKRISFLQPYVIETESESEDKTDAPELPESEQICEIPLEQAQAGFDVNIEKITAIALNKNTEKSVVTSPKKHSTLTDISNNITSNVIVQSLDSSSRCTSPKLIIDLSLSINETGNNVLDTIKRVPNSPPQIDIPERDYNCTRRITQVTTEKEVITEVETQRTKSRKGKNEEDSNFDFKFNKKSPTDPFADMSLSQDGPSSLSSKSFTGSLNDLHSESMKELHVASKLIRQRSYTLLKPSPQLLAHLEVQSLNTGVEMSSISMSESLSNISSPNKKRRSWDLESAKVKWSSMALELKHTNIVQNINRNISNRSVAKPLPKKPAQTTPPLRTKPEKTKRSMVTPKPMMRSNTISNSDPKPMTRSMISNSETLNKSEPVAKTRKSLSPIRNNNNRSYIKDQLSPKANIKMEPLSLSSAPPPSVCETDDPASRVRELYEKIQSQQLLQMASLVEKQKREQLLLQQVFEEQNNLLFKQLKTICPKSPIEVKEAWGEKHVDNDRGPVSLSQLMNYKSPEQSSFSSPVSVTLTDTNKYINHCNNVLKKSRDITGSIKKQPNNIRSQNGNKNVSPRAPPDGSRTRTHSPASRMSPRRLNYDTSCSSDREYEPMLTDRTNDTLADLNVTFPSDHSEDCNSYHHHPNSAVSQLFGKEVKIIHGSGSINSAVHSRTTDNAIRNMERTIHNSINNTNSRGSKPKFNMQPTPAEQAAATKIVAAAKGYLVRRLMRTDRVQATVQTIKDALLCALQLHQDREGIRGADVDLHRRLIQQITAACYSLHDTFVASSAAERCAMIAADRGRRRVLAARQTSNSFRHTDVMSQSHSGVFPARNTQQSTASPMTQSNYETFSGDKRPGVSVSRHMSPHRRPWR